MLDSVEVSFELGVVVVLELVEFMLRERGGFDMGDIAEMHNGGCGYYIWGDR